MILHPSLRCQYVEVRLEGLFEKEGGSRHGVTMTTAFAKCTERSITCAQKCLVTTLDTNCIVNQRKKDAQVV